MSALYVMDAEGVYRVARREEIIAAGKAAVRIRKGASLRSPKDALDYMVMNFGALEYELFGCLWLSKRHTLIKAEALFRGTIDGASVHPREIVRSALECNAAAVIIHHNHPSGVAMHSHADELITKLLKEALELIGVRVLDHMIVAGDEWMSFAEQGLL